LVVTELPDNCTLCNRSREAQQVCDRLLVAGLRTPHQARVNHVGRDAHHGVGVHVPDTGL
jgi:hypothetical protein